MEYAEGGRRHAIEDAYSIVDLPYIPDERGALTFVEGNRHVPFDIERVYYLYGVPPGGVRAGHAHLALKQLMIAAYGSLTVNLDNGYEKISVRLSSPSQGLLIGSMLWRTLSDFSEASVCLVLASLAYTEDDYIRDYAAFLKAVRNAE